MQQRKKCQKRAGSKKKWEFLEGAKVLLMACDLPLFRAILIGL